MNKQNFILKNTIVALLSVGSMVMISPANAASKSSGKSKSYSSYKSFNKKTLIKAAPIVIAPVVAPVVATTPPPTPPATPTTVQTQAPTPTKAQAPTPTTVQAQAPRAANTHTVTQLTSQPQVANPYLNNKAAGTNYAARGNYSSFNKGYNTSRMATTRYASDYDDDDCLSSLYQSQTPVVLNKKLNADAVFLCFDGFSVLYSPVSRTPLWSAEYLTPSRLMIAKSLDRVDNFHEEFRLNSNAQATLSDYSGSGFDRGHLAPNADMSSRNQQFDSFSLANIVPQAPELNRGSWADLEKQVRTNVFDYGDAYVVTGVTFTGATVSSLKSRVLVPNALYKIIYYPTVDRIEAFYAKNTNSSTVQSINPAELINLTGVNPFPTLLTAKPIEQDTSMVDNTVIRNSKQVDESSDTEDGYLGKILLGLGVFLAFLVTLVLFSKFKSSVYNQF